MWAASLVAWTSLAFVPPPIGKYDCVRTAPFHPAIHNMGNVGASGRLHARSAWFATNMIDRLAYNGVDMRTTLAQCMQSVTSKGSRLLEIGCGAGTLTQKLERLNHFNLTAIDTSSEMLSVARQNTRECELRQGNGIDERETFDAVVMCMVAHEMPSNAHREMLQHLVTIAPTLWIVDIDTAYRPSLAMLSGEPYVTDYLVNFEQTIDDACVNNNLICQQWNIVDHHVKCWVVHNSLYNSAGQNGLKRLTTCTGN